MTTKQLVFDVFDQKNTDRVLSGFWFHFSPKEDLALSVGKKEVWQRTLDGHRRYSAAVHPEILKIMSDGYFTLPNIYAIDERDPDQLAALQPLPDDDPWFSEQIELAKILTSEAGDDAAVFYTIFSPLSSVYFADFGKNSGNGDSDVFVRTAAEYPAALKHALSVLAGDWVRLIRRLFSEAGIDGIYYSVRTFSGLDKAAYRNIAEESDRIVLDAANALSDNNMLHICGYAGLKNDLALYSTYPAKVYNWDVHIENLTLHDGKKFFGGKTVLGGFNNRQQALIHTGSQAEIEAETLRLIAETGAEGFILGADCTVPDDIDFLHLIWVRDAAASSRADRR
jgi:uroporphyrinogen decarboxylase